MSPIEIAGKIHELIKKKHLDYDFCVLVHYTKHKEEAVCIGTKTDTETKNVCKQHLVDAIQCPTCYPYRTIADLQIYSAIWKEGIIVLAGISFDPRTILDESIRQLGIGIE